MIIVSLKIDEKQLQLFNDMCQITKTDPSSKLRMMVDSEITLFQEQERRRKARNVDGWVDISVQQQVIHSAY
jgi:hypothetical protein